MHHATSRARFALTVVAVGVFVAVCLIMSAMARSSGAPVAFSVIPILFAVVGLGVIAVNAWSVFTGAPGSGTGTTGTHTTGIGKHFDPLARGPNPNFCAHCGNPLTRDDNFCAHCGMPARD